MKFKCDICDKEFFAGNRPDGLPNGVGFCLDDGLQITVCSDCIMDNERLQRFLDDFNEKEQR